MFFLKKIPLAAVPGSPPFRAAIYEKLWRHVPRTSSCAVRVIRLSLLLLAAPFAADAATFYVSPSGNDSNAGTQTAPFRTMARGLRGSGTLMQPGDTLYLRGGTYNEGINSNNQTIPTGTSWTDAPRIAGYPGESAVITRGLNLAASYIKYVIVDNLIFDGQQQRYGLSFQNGANHIRIQNSEVKNVYGQGIEGGFGSLTTTHIELLRMKIHHNGDPTIETCCPGNGGRFDHGVYAAIQNMLIENCDIYDNTGLGLQIYWGSGASTSNTVIRNNRIHNNHGDGNVVLSDGDNVQFYNNLVYNAKNGVDVSYRITNAKVYNNTLYNHTERGVQILSGSTGAQIRNNILFQNAVAPITDWGGAQTTTSNNLTTDPKFVNAAAADFRLTSASFGAIDKGTAISIVIADFDGVSRPQGAAYDIGAYEYGSSSASPCDLNGDGSTNVNDVQSCANQATMASPCSTGDINRDTLCNVLDVQRVVNAVLGGTCVTP